MLQANAICAAMVALGIPRADVACSYVPEVVEKSAKYGVRTTVMLSLMHEESRFRPDAVSSAGACGMTQVLPRYTRNPRLSCRALLDPTISIEAGAKALSQWYESKYAAKNYLTALCSYNAGYRCKRKKQNYSKRGMGYARRVLRRANKLQKQANYFLIHAESLLAESSLNTCKNIVE